MFHTLPPQLPCGSFSSVACWT